MCSSDKKNDLDTNQTCNNSTSAGFKREGIGINTVLLRRLRHLSPLLFPGMCCLPTVLFLLLLITCFLEQYIVYNVGLISSRYYLVLGQMDWPGFVSTTLYSIGLVVTIAVVLSGKSYISSILYISWRQVMTRALHSAYFSGVNYYAITITPHLDLDNPDMRMTQDVDLLCKTLGTMVATLIIAPFKISYYTYQAYAGTGWLGPTLILVFFLVSSVINRFVMNPIVPCVVESEKCEGNLRFKHMQIRAGSESVAFHVSGAVEATKTNAALDELVRAKQRLFNRQFWLNLCQNLFDYLGSILSYLAIAVPIFGGAYGSVDSSVLSSIISKNAFVCIMLISSLGGLVGLCSSVVQLAGAAHRIGHLLEALLSLDRSWHAHNSKASASFTDLTRGGGNDDGGWGSSPLPPPYFPAPHPANTPLLAPSGRVHDGGLEFDENPSTGILPPSLRRPSSSKGREVAEMDTAAHEKLITVTSPCDVTKELVVLSDDTATSSPDPGTTPSYTVVSAACTNSVAQRVQENENIDGPAIQRKDYVLAASTDTDVENDPVCRTDSLHVCDANDADIFVRLDTKERTPNDSPLISKTAATRSNHPSPSPLATDTCSNTPASVSVPSFSGATFPIGFLLQSVTLCVPGTNTALVKDLTLNIARGHNLLIMGPSSCGKTSLLRALRGLWPIQEGVLAYQSYRGPKAVMFLPQKPFLTNGTLREQIVYPEQLVSGPQLDTDCESVVIDPSNENGTETSTRSVSSNFASGTNSIQPLEGNESDQPIEENVGVDAAAIPASVSAMSRTQADGSLPSFSCHVANMEKKSTGNSINVVCSTAATDDMTTGHGVDVPKECSDSQTPSVDSDIKQWLSQLQMSSLLQRCGGLDTDPGWVWSDVLSPGEVQRLCFLRVLYHRPQFAILDEASSALSNDVESALYSLAAKAGVTVISVGHRNTLRQFHHSLLSLDGRGGWRLDALH